MLNINSPTVQSMLANTPLGLGNIPIYNGASPTITTETIQNPIQHQNSQPYPSPKDMVLESGFYQPTQFAPSPTMQGDMINRTPFLGGYAIQYSQPTGMGYSQPYNPYVGGLNNQYGQYNNYNQFGYYNNMQPMYIDQQTRYTIEAAYESGISYSDQIVQESTVYKMLSRACSKVLGRSEEETKAHEKYFDIVDRYANTRKQSNGYAQPQERTPVKTLQVQIIKGDEILADSTNNSRDFYPQSIEYMNGLFRQSEIVEKQMEDTRIKMYNNAPERRMDNMSMFDFFNHGYEELVAYERQISFLRQKARGVNLLYDRNGYRKRLFENNGIKDKFSRGSSSEPYIIHGRYGVMPDGRPTSPGVDPSIAESFSLNTKTGQISISPPDFLTNRFERARNTFVESIGRDDLL